MKAKQGHAVDCDQYFCRLEHCNWNFPQWHLSQQQGQPLIHCPMHWQHPQQVDITKIYILIFTHSLLQVVVQEWQWRTPPIQSWTANIFCRARRRRNRQRSVSTDVFTRWEETSIASSWQTRDPLNARFESFLLEFYLNFLVLGKSWFGNSI